AAAALAPLAARAARESAASGRWDARWEREWERCWRRRVLARQRGCRMLARALRRPRLVAAAVTVLGGWPSLSTPLLRRLGAPPAAHVAARAPGRPPWTRASCASAPRRPTRP